MKVALMKWTVVEIEQFEPVDPSAELFHESMEPPVAYYTNRREAWNVAAYLNGNPFWSEFLLSMQKYYLETLNNIGETGDNDYNEGYADGISMAINHVLDKIEKMREKNNKNDEFVDNNQLKLPFSQ